MRSPIAGGPSEQIAEVPADAFPGWDCPQRSDRLCVLSRKEEDHAAFYEIDPVRGLGKEVAKVQWPVGNWSISPDGTHLAIEVHAAVRTIDLRSGNEHTLPNTWTLFSLAWAPGGKAVYAAAQSSDYILVRFEMDGKTRVLLDRGRNQWIGNLSLSPDGHSLAFSQQSFDSNAWLLENF